MVDIFFCYVLIIPTADHTSTTVAKTLYHHLVAYIGSLHLEEPGC